MHLALIESWDTTIQTWATALGWPMEAVLRLIMACVLGGMIGLEREFRGREAGFRTNMLVCIGSALVMIVSTHFADHAWKPQPGVNLSIDPARIAYGVMTGVGFLGAGTIIRNEGSVHGLTTAAGVWCVAAVGLAAGFGLYLLAILATLLIVAALSVFNYLEVFIPPPKYRSVTLRTAYRPGCVEEAMEIFRKVGLKATEASLERIGDLSQANIHFSTALRADHQYAALEKAIREDSRFELLAAQYR